MLNSLCLLSLLFTNKVITCSCVIAVHHHRLPDHHLVGCHDCTHRKADTCATSQWNTSLMPLYNRTPHCQSANKVKKIPFFFTFSESLAQSLIPLKYVTNQQVEYKRAQRALERSPETEDFFIALYTTGNTWEVLIWRQFKSNVCKRIF